MKKTSLLLIGIFFFVIDVLAQNDEIVSPSYILLQNAMIIDCIGSEAIKGDLLIKDQQIEKISYQEAIVPPKGAIIYDLEKKYIIPGLIDAHVHYATDPSGSDNIKDTKRRLEILLENGITSVRDMAGDTRVLGYLARAAALNEIQSPSIYYASLMAGRSFFEDPRTHSSAKAATAGDCAWMKAVDLKTDMKLAVAEAKGTSATGIKVYANLPIPVIEKIVTEAHKQNLKVWSHATVFPARPQEIIDAGVDVVSHATLLAWEGVDTLDKTARRRYATQEKFDINNPAFEMLMNTMKDKGTILDATLAVYEMQVFDESIFTQGVELTRLAYQNEVKIGVGTDINIDQFAKGSPLLREMELLVQEVGMKPLEALKAATMVNAEMIGQEKKIGSLTTGKQADIIVLNKNPLIDITNIGNIKYVFKNGERIKF